MPNEEGSDSVSECPKCGKEVQPVFKLCPFCGTKLEVEEPKKEPAPPTVIKCIKCDREIKPRFKFCPYCRTPQKPKDLEAMPVPEGIVICTECSKPIKPRFKKCPYCGAKQEIREIRVEKVEGPKETIAVETEPMAVEMVEEFSADDVKSCKKCSKDIPQTHRFCPHCGSMQ